MVMVDLAGFSKAIGPLSSMQLAELVDAFYRLMADAIESHGGRVIKFVGDGCLAVFDEADAVAAVACLGEVVEPSEPSVAPMASLWSSARTCTSPWSSKATSAAGPLTSSGQE